MCKWGAGAPNMPQQKAAASSMPQVSVVMAVYNGEAYLAEAIDSILAQTLRDFELIIVDDGSTDGSASIAYAYQRRDSRIRILQLERNGGLSAARNHGIRAANAEYIALMDCDDISLPQRLEKQAAFLHAKPDISVVGTCGVVLTEDLGPQFPFDVPARHGVIALQLFYGASFLDPSTMLRREYPLLVGGYDETIAYGTDLALNLRLLLEAGARFANLPDRLHLYRRHGASMSAHAATKGLPAEIAIRRRALRQLWTEVPAATLERFQKLRYQQSLHWRERYAAKRDILALISSLIERGLVDSSERPVMLAAMQRRLEQASPRRWQQWLHWYRYRILGQAATRAAAADA